MYAYFDKVGLPCSFYGSLEILVLSNKAATVELQLKKATDSNKELKHKQRILTEEVEYLERELELERQFLPFIHHPPRL